VKINIMKNLICRKLIRASVLAITLFSAIQNLQAQQLVTKDLPQYMFSDFAPADIKMKKGNDIALDLNYNTATGKMVFLLKGSFYDMVNPQSSDTVYLQDRIFVPYDTVFFEVIVKGEIPFYIQYKSDISLRSKPTMSGTTQVSSSNYYTGGSTAEVYFNQKLPPEFSVKSYTQYWVRINGEMKSYTNERQLLKIFTQNAEQIKSFIRESDLDIQKRADLVKIGNYCNVIVK
jgi:hypothetical protein